MCAAGQGIRRQQRASRDTVRDDIHISIEQAYANFEEKALAAAADAKGNAKAALHNVKGGLLKLFGSALPANLSGYDQSLGRKDCGLFGLACHAHNIAVDATHAAYQKPRNRMSSAFEQPLTQAAKGTHDAATSGDVRVESALRGETARAAAQTRKRIDFSLLLNTGLSVAAGAILLMIAVRALLLLFLRVCCSAQKSRITRP